MGSSSDERSGMPGTATPGSAIQRCEVLGCADATDVLADSHGQQEFTAPRVATKNTHGTGCTLSSAIAALLPVMPRADAVRAAKAYLTEALKHADELTVGHGHGPVRHFP